MVTYDYINQILTISVEGKRITIPDVSAHIADKAKAMTTEEVLGYAEILLANRKVTKILGELWD